MRKVSLKYTKRDHSHCDAHCSDIIVLFFLSRNIYRRTVDCEPAIHHKNTNAVKKDDTSCYFNVAQQLT